MRRKKIKEGELKFSSDVERIGNVGDKFKFLGVDHIIVYISFWEPGLSPFVSFTLYTNYRDARGVLRPAEFHWREFDAIYAEMERNDDPVGVS